MTRTFLPTCLLLVALLTPRAAGQATAERPNVVILLADDLGYGDLGCYGGKIGTPRIDALAAQGALFTTAYAPAPVCTPSRAGLFSGKYPARIGVQANTGVNKVARKHERGLPGEVVTLPERLHELGYYSGLIGKWHLGLKEGMKPNDQGFDEFFGFLGASHVYLPDDTDAKMLRNEKPEAEHEKEYLTDALAREAEAFLARNKEKRFVLTLAFNAPHNPFQASDKYMARFPALTGKEKVYAAMVSALDDAVGRVLDALEKEGLAQNTVVFFASDNGAPLQESSGSNGELSEGKGLLFEGGNRVPLMVRWPGHATAGTHVAAPVELLDVTATTLALAGAPKEALAELDGLDLAPLLAGETPPERTFFWKVGPSAAIRKGAWKLVTSKDNRWLFDLGTDPEEHADLVDAKGAVADTLATELDAWIAKLPKPLWGNEGNETPVTVLGKQYWVTY